MAPAPDLMTHSKHGHDPIAGRSKHGPSIPSLCSNGRKTMRTILLATFTLGLVGSSAMAAQAPRSAMADAPSSTATAGPKPAMVALKAAPTLEQKRAVPRRGRPVLMALKAPPL
jgi:hypothetical protein